MVYDNPSGLLPILGGVRTIQLWKKVSGNNWHPHLAKLEICDNVLVSESDFHRLDQYRWNRLWSPTTHSYVATRHEHPNGKTLTVYMARVVLGLPAGAGSRALRADHINFDTLDNRQENLREVTPAESSAHIRKMSHGRSNFKGVYRDYRRSGFFTAISYHGQRVNFPSVGTEVEAALMYFYAAKFLNGEFCPPHEIPDEEMPTEKRQEQLWLVVCRRLIKAGLMMPRPD